MDWYPWFPTKFKRKTYQLTLAEDGAYRRLIDEYMTTRSPLPDDDRALSRILGVSADEWQSVAANVRPFFRVRDGLLRHKTCEEELAAQDTKMKRFSERGKKAAFAKYSKINHVPASRMLIPARVHNIPKTSTEYVAPSEGAIEEGIGVATPELAALVGKWRGG